MGSSSNRRTTIAKRNRELRLLERRAAKQAKKDARKREVNGEGPSAGPADVDEVDEPQEGDPDA